MIKVKIGEEERHLDAADAQWVNQQINQRRAHGQSVCVRVFIEKTGINIMLSTPNCNGGGVGRRPPNLLESQLFDLWDERGLDDLNFSGGNLTAFLKQLKSLCP